MSAIFRDARGSLRGILVSAGGFFGFDMMNAGPVAGWNQYTTPYTFRWKSSMVSQHAGAADEMLSPWAHRRDLGSTGYFTALEGLKESGRLALAGHPLFFPTRRFYFQGRGCPLPCISDQLKVITSVRSTLRGL
jgi:hypothetical protein